MLPAPNELIIQFKFNSNLIVNQVAAIGGWPHNLRTDTTVAVMLHLLISAVTAKLHGQPDKHRMEWSSDKLHPSWTDQYLCSWKKNSNSTKNRVTRDSS